MLDALPAELPLSVEWSTTPDSGHTSYTWAAEVYAVSKKYLDGYYARKAAQK
jgi:hypothetical protein